MGFIVFWRQFTDLWEDFFNWNPFKLITVMESQGEELKAVSVFILF